MNTYKKKGEGEGGYGAWYKTGRIPDGAERTHFRFMAQVLLKFVRPFAGGMKNRENAHLILFYPVRDEERRSCDDQLPSTGHAPLPARHGMPAE